MEHNGKGKKLLGKWDFIFMLGESGGGKGTLVKSIKKWWLPGISTSSMGDIIRNKSKTDPEIKRLTDEGILINDELVVDLFKDFANNATLPGLMDGFPRKREQADEVIRFLGDKNWNALVIDLHCDLEVIISRLLARGRADDKLSIMYKRNADHKTLHPAVMEKIKERPDIFDVIYLNGNYTANIVFTNLLLDVMRLVDIKYYQDMVFNLSSLRVQEGEDTVEPMLIRWICEMLQQLEKQI